MDEVRGVLLGRVRGYLRRRMGIRCDIMLRVKENIYKCKEEAEEIDPLGRMEENWRERRRR